MPPRRPQGDRVDRPSRKRDAADSTPCRRDNDGRSSFDSASYDLQDLGRRPRPEEFGPTFFRRGTTRDRMRAGEVEGPRWRGV